MKRISWVGSGARQNGFTIVELLVVIVVIAVLASVVIVSYSGISQRARETSVKSDLLSYTQKLEIDKTVGGAMSSSIASSYLLVDGPNTTVSYKYGDLEGSCLEAASKSNGSIKYYVDTASSMTDTQQGACPATTSMVVMRCVVGKVILVTSQVNYFSESVTAQVQSAYGTTAPKVMATPGTNELAAQTTSVVSIPRGVVTITLTSASFTVTRFHAYEPFSC